MAIRVGGAWRSETGNWVRAGGSWRTIIQEWVARVDPILGFEWRLVFDRTTPDVTVPNPNFSREGTGVIGPLTLVVTWTASPLPERSGWSVQATVQGDFYFGQDTKHQSVGSMTFNVPANERGGLFVATVRYVNANGSGPETVLYYQD